MHLKREQSPKNWPVKRKGTAYLVRPRYSIDKGIPISIAVRDVLGLAKTRKEVKKAINSRQILLDSKPVTDERSNALLFDIITIVPPKGSSISEKHYRVVIDGNKKFNLEEISGREAGHKVSKVVNKKTLKGKKVQLNLSDGRNFISDMKCNVNDSVKINLKEKKIGSHIPFKVGANVFVFAGKHAGEKGTIKEIEPNRVKLESKGKMISILTKQIIVTD